MKGQRVKLTDKAASGLSKRNKNKTDWHNRVGTIVSVYNGNVRVIWDDRKTIEEALPLSGFIILPNAKDESCSTPKS